MENLKCWFLQLKEVGREPCQVRTADLIFCYLSLRVPAVPAEQALSCSTADPDDPHGCHTYIMYCGIFPSRLNELNFLDSRVNVDVRAFRDNVEYLLKK